MQAVYDVSEPAGEEEANTIDLKVQTLVLNMTLAAKIDFKIFCMNLIFLSVYLQVSLDMTPDDVVQKILELCH